MEASTVQAYRELVAEYLASQAAWRRSKAEEWPDDERNAGSAAALQAAAEYVMQADDRLFAWFVQFDEAMREGWSEHFTPDAGTGVLSLDDAGNRAVTGFWFSTTERDPGERDFAAVVRYVFDGLVRTWRDTIEASGDTPASDLYAYFDGWGAPLGEDDE